MTTPSCKQKQIHKNQINKARKFIRAHFKENISLDMIAKSAASSAFHFSRVFLSYTDETIFDFLRRVRILHAMKLLQDDMLLSMTDISALVGYDTPSAFNKVFKKLTTMSPSTFRNLGKDDQSDLIYSISQPKRTKEIIMNLNKQYETLIRPEMHLVYFEDTGPFQEIAPPLWGKLAQVIPTIPREKVYEYLGLGIIDKNKTGEEIMIYQAGLSVDPDTAQMIMKSSKGMSYKTVPQGKYAKFLLTGSYSHIWKAFNEVFKILTEQGISIRKEFSIENYLNDPATTPESDLLTEIIIPIE